MFSWFHVAVGKPGFREISTFFFFFFFYIFPLDLYVNYPLTVTAGEGEVGACSKGHYPSSSPAHCHSPVSRIGVGIH